MEARTCPICGSTRVTEEKRRLDARSMTTIGAWRIPYSLVAGVIVLIIGILCLVFIQTATNPFFVELAVIGAAISFVFAAFVLGSVVYFSRWDESVFCRCEACNALWPVGDPANIIERPTRTTT